MQSHRDYQNLLLQLYCHWAACLQPPLHAFKACNQHAVEQEVFKRQTNIQDTHHHKPDSLQPSSDPSNAPLHLSGTHSFTTKACSLLAAYKGRLTIQSNTGPSCGQRQPTSPIECAAPSDAHCCGLDCMHIMPSLPHHPRCGQGPHAPQSLSSGWGRWRCHAYLCALKLLILGRLNHADSLPQNLYASHTA